MKNIYSYRKDISSDTPEILNHYEHKNIKEKNKNITGKQSRLLRRRYCVLTSFQRPYNVVLMACTGYNKI